MGSPNLDKYLAFQNSQPASPNIDTFFNQGARADDLLPKIVPKPVSTQTEEPVADIDKSGLETTAMDRIAENISSGITAGKQLGGKILARMGTITQGFGQRSSADKYSGGVNYGTDFAVPRGTKVAAPPGEWRVVEAFSGASKEGPNNAEGGINRGYGNSALIENTRTGQKLRFSHLRVGGVAVKPGQVISGGTLIGETGASGNTAGQTGQHLDIEYYDALGKLADIMKSQYAQSIM